MTARLWLAVVLSVALVGLAVAGERFPGQNPGVPQPGEWDKANWTWEEHVWYMLHQLVDNLAPVIAVALAGAGGGFLARKKKK